jgi:anthranilate synthase component 1
MQKLVVAILATFRINAADYRLTGHGVFLSMAFFLLKELMRSQLFTAEATFQADLITPIAAYQALKPEAPVLLFESMEGSGRSGRFTVIAMEPLLRIRHFHGQTTVSGTWRVNGSEDSDPLAHLQALLQRFRQPPKNRFRNAFFAGNINFSAYRFSEPQLVFPTRTDYAEVDLFLPGVVLCFDNFYQELSIIVHLPESSNDAGRAAKKINAIKDKLAAWQWRFGDAAANGGGKANLNSAAADRFQIGVEKVKEHIRVGDIFQAVLARKTFVPGALDALSVYRRLRRLNPSPYMYLLQYEDYSIVGASPETMVKVDEDTITMRPIAGTRKRGGDAGEEQQLKQDLCSDPKELAEHDMLVDLARNDIGKVAEFGSVEVPVYRQVETFSHVMHLVSTVTGRKRENYDCVDVFRACFPAGTVSGAPKIRAVEIINAIEQEDRGPYGGAIGYFDLAGRMDTCIAIRTAIIERDYSWWQAGAGIVADSKAESEWRETENKGGIFRSIVSGE